MILDMLHLLFYSIVNKAIELIFHGYFLSILNDDLQRK